MLPKSFSSLLLLVAIQFSQIFAAPHEGITLDKLDPSFTASATVDTKPMQNQFEASLNDSVQSVRESDGENFANSLPSAAQSMGEQVEENVEDSIRSASDQVENVVDYVPSEKDENEPFKENSENNLSHMLTREEELKILHQVPEFTQIIQAMERLPDDVYEEMKNFLKSTVPRMPQDNLFTKHFENAEILVQMFERLIKIARTEGAIYEPSSRALFDRVHKAAPEMKKEMDQFNRFIEDSKSRLTSLGTSSNPLDSMTQPPTAGINVATGSVSLPVQEESEDFADEFAPSAVSTE